MDLFTNDMATIITLLAAVLGVVPPVLSFFKNAEVNSNAVKESISITNKKILT